MSQRRSRAPVQHDPVFERLGKPAVARDVICPACGVTFATTVRWEMHCPDCGNRWTDRSRRTVIDKLRDHQVDFLGNLIIFGGVIGLLVAFAMVVGTAFSEAVNVRGWDRTAAIAAFFSSCVVSIVLLGRLRS